MKRFATTLLLALGMLLGVNGTARAATLYTVATQATATQYPICLLVNVDKKPAAVSIVIADAITGADITNASTCTGQVAPGQSCEVGAPSGSAAYCKFTSSSAKVRATLIVFGTDGVVTNVPATK